MYHLPRKQVGSVENGMQDHKGHDYNVGSQSTCWLVSKQVGSHRRRRSEDAILIHNIGAAALPLQ